MQPRSNLVSVPVLLSICLGAGCSGSVEFSFGGADSPDGAAVNLIESDLSDRLGLGPLNAVCNEPGSNEVGTLFLCRADASGERIEFEVLIDADDHILVVPTNVLAPDDLATLAATAAEVLNAEVGSALLPDSIDCGSDVVVADPTGETTLECALTSPDSGLVYDTEIAITDLDTGAFTVQVADTPRP